MMSRMIVCYFFFFLTFDLVAVVAGISCIFFFFNDTATTHIYTSGHTLSLHDALPIYERALDRGDRVLDPGGTEGHRDQEAADGTDGAGDADHGRGLLGRTGNSGHALRRAVCGRVHRALAPDQRDHPVGRTVPDAGGGEDEEEEAEEPREPGLVLLGNPHRAGRVRGTLRAGPEDGQGATDHGHEENGRA